MTCDNGWIKSVPIAHRGFHNNEFPENSIGAFINATKHGFAIELDVQLSADCNIVVFHDNDTLRMTREKGDIRELNLCQIKKRRLLGSDFEIPTLKEVFESVDIATPILIEIKNDKRPGILEARLCSEIDAHHGICAVQSFNSLSLRFVKQRCPHILRGQLARNYSEKGVNIFKRIILNNFLQANLSEPHFISYRIGDLPNKRIDSFRKRGIPVIGWTIATEKDFYNAKKYCDNIIFEDIQFIEDFFSFYK